MVNLNSPKTQAVSDRCPDRLRSRVAPRAWAGLLAMLVSTHSQASAELKHLSIWTSPAPAPDNVFVALLSVGDRAALYCEPLVLQPDFQPDIVRYNADVPYSFDINVLASATAPAVSIEMSLTPDSGEALPVASVEAIEVTMRDVALALPRVWSFARATASGNLSVHGMPVGENTLEISVRSGNGGASRTYTVVLNRTAPGPGEEGEPECPQPALDALQDAASEMHPGEWNGRLPP